MPLNRTPAAAMDRHFPLNSTIPQYMYVRSPQDLRTPKALADLEQMAQRVSQLPNIAAVRGITRPTGESLEQARLSQQAGEVGDKLRDASGEIRDKTSDLDQLAGGANAMAQNLGDIRGGVSAAIASVGRLSTHSPTWRPNSAEQRRSIKSTRRQGLSQVCKPWETPWG
jgi:putative drug exporter of the RND superfamily